MHGRIGTSVLILSLAALLLQGCGASIIPGETGATSQTPPLAPPAQTATDAPAASPAEPAAEGGTMATLKAMMPKGEQIVGTPTELYTRIARGALTCWFGSAGPLKGGYMYHAEAAPPSKGGRSEIVIRVKDTTAGDPRSLRAYRIVIAPGETGSVMEIENTKIPEPLAASLAADARRWAAAEEGCSAAPAADAWTAGNKSPETVTGAVKKPSGQKSGKAANKKAAH